MAFHVKDYMVKDIPTIDTEASALEACKIMTVKQEAYLIVFRGEQPEGIVTEGDLMRKIVGEQRDASATKVSEIMSAPLITVNPDETVTVAVKTMVDRNVRRLPVVRDGILYGVFTMREMMRHFNEYNDRIVRDIFRSMSLLHM
jgi:CBS domain-containing protein